MLPLTARNARLEKTARIARALIDSNDAGRLELRSKAIHAELQRLPDVAANIEPKCSKINGCWYALQVPPNEESFVRCQVLAKIMDRSFQLRRPVGEQDHLCFFREPSEAGRTRQSVRDGIRSIAGSRQGRCTGSTNDSQKSAPVHEINSHRLRCAHVSDT